MCFVKSIIFIIMWFSWTLVFGLITLPAFLFPKNNIIYSKCCKIWAEVTLFFLRIICQIKVKVIGDIPKYPCIVASKHQSAWETIFFLTFFNNPVFVIKKELTKIPIYGWYLAAAGMIIIDRKSGSNALKQIKHGAEEAINSGRTFIIFPEGTRTKPGSSVKYKSGISFLRDNFTVPIIPVALNSGSYWLNKSIIRKPGSITVKILPQFKEKEYFLKELQELIDSESENL